MSTTRTAVLAAVERSPAAAAAHDRAGWVGLFTAGARIEDPVGSRPHTGRAEIEQFYDTFIGPRDITFHRDIDIVCGTTVLRDLVLEVAMNASVTMRIPALLRYDLAEVGDALAIDRLQAYWELPAMAWKFTRNGPAAFPAAVALTRALLTNQGPAGALGFVAGVNGVGARGRRLVGQLVDDAVAGDEMTVKRRLGDAEITAGDSGRLRPSELVAALTGKRRRTILTAGRHVVVSLSGTDGAAVLITEVGVRPSRVRRVRLFTETPR
ncbi:ketosteroid isomerase family protein [Mycolicibacterium neoaurum]|uniref:ketosteroid isomerase family protein n=1 Tax=Mycolicibacterium neoaurum TaxID=1795 RepID=UPI0004BE4059|nr:ketosteroid isomerase family protein [Mycolicibacterium neoaurum]QVI25672.1 nuclear transport factor 2 family protein [Mycolicibacterium neoaurum]TLH62475.1 hypothetical protein C1S81_02575 [Mycolicibacterium neoaurum]